jgi:hypothetical protein
MRIASAERRQAMVLTLAEALVRAVIASHESGDCSGRMRSGSSSRGSTSSLSNCRYRHRLKMGGLESVPSAGNRVRAGISRIADTIQGVAHARIQGFPSDHKGDSSEVRGARPRMIGNAARITN